MTALEGARQWCARGFWPIPVPYREKGPNYGEWQNLRLQDEADLTKHFARKCNVGVLLGEPKGATDVDLDSAEAIAAWQELGLPTKLVFGRESKRRSHYLYRSWPPVRTAKYEDAGKVTLVELRGLKKNGEAGLQTLAPPSAHPCGEPIEFEPGCDGEPAAVDGRILQLAVARTAGAALLARHWPAEHAGRHDAFLALGGMLVRAGWPLEETQKFVRAIYRALWPANPDFRAADLEVAASFRQFEEGGEITGCPTLAEKIADPKAMAKVIEWLNLRHVTQAGPKSQPMPESWDDPIPLLTRTVPAIQPEWIPGPLGDMALATARSTETPLEMAALLGVPVVSCCLAGKVEIDVEPGYWEPANTYAAVAMESGNRKTAVINELTRPVNDYESAERRRLEPEITRAKNKRKAIEERIAWLRKQAAKSPANATFAKQLADAEESLPDVPRAPQLWTQDTTSEKLAQLLQDHGERMGVFSDEGDLFDLLAGRYTGGVPNFDIFLHGHSASPVRVSRISRPDVFLDRPMLSIGLSPQPAVLERLRDTPAFRHRGLVARFLYALPPSSLGDRKLTPQPCPAEVRDAYQKLITRLIGLTPPTVNGACQPWRLKFSDEAYLAWKKFQRDVEEMMREGGKLERLRDWGSKLPGAVVRLAGIFHAVVVKDLTGNPVISHDTIERAIKLGTALIDHALAVFDLMERDPTFEGAQKILEWIRRGKRKSFTQRECFCAHQKRFRRVAAIRPALELLVEHAYLRRAPKTPAPNRPSEVFEVHPRWPKEGA
jgi:hypothetical protein